MADLEDAANEDEAGQAALHAALMQGEQSGPSAPFDFDAHITTKRNGDAVS